MEPNQIFMAEALEVVSAVYENGVFKPMAEISLKEHSRVSLVVSSIDMELGDDSSDTVKSQKKALSELIGIGSSGFDDVSVNHDKYLYQ